MITLQKRTFIRINNFLIYLFSLSIFFKILQNSQLPYLLHFTRLYFKFHIEEEEYFLKILN